MASSASPSDDVFLKTGASGTSHSSFLACFTDGSTIDLDGRTGLQTTIDFHAAGDADGATPFERSSLAVGVGRTAAWAIAGSPSPLDDELGAIGPRTGLVDFGTNDMELGATYGDTIRSFHDSMQQLLDDLEGGGVVPVVTGLNPRADSAAAALWVPTFDVVTRGIAEQRHLAYLSLYRSMVDLPDMGLGVDGIHGNTYDPGAGSEPCDFSAAALQFNYNLRNLRTLELLDVVRRSGLGTDPATSVDETWTGDGSTSDPWRVDRLPFTHSADSSTSPNDSVDEWTGCGSAQRPDPEVWYRLELAESRALRLQVLDRGATDVDLFLVSGAPEAAGCIVSASHLLETTLGAGTYHLAIDSEAGLAGAYLLAVVECEAGDPDCL